MNIPILKNFEKWKELNSETNFSLYDYIFHLVKLNKINSDIYFAFFKLFWPSFLLYKDYVILEENFSEKKIEDLIRNKKKIEFWMNLFLTDSYFEDEKKGAERAESLARSLVEIWKVKLKKDFPTRNFTVKYVYDKGMW